MIIYPAIDMKDGKCVRLVQGDFARVTEFNDDVLDQAKQFEDAGFEWLHMVDLDGAKKGQAVNYHHVENVLKNTSLKVQIGGGVRDMEAIEKLIGYGVSRVVLGTVAIKNFDLVREACKRFPGKIAVGIDAKGNKVAIQGWVEETDIYVFDLIEKLSDLGVSAIIYTDISKDGLLSGIDESGTRDIASSMSIPLIASGGVSQISDLEAVKSMENIGVEGVIVGRAFYDKKISFQDALNVAHNIE
jgi:phosphoribosylformimino-5-aminoimidazole carboxamide ribotide isomerase